MPYSDRTQRSEYGKQWRKEHPDYMVWWLSHHPDYLKKYWLRNPKKLKRVRKISMLWHRKQRLKRRRVDKAHSKI